MEEQTTAGCNIHVCKSDTYTKNVCTTLKFCKRDSSIVLADDTDVAVNDGLGIAKAMTWSHFLIGKSRNAGTVVAEKALNSDKTQLDFFHDFPDFPNTPILG